MKQKEFSYVRSLRKSRKLRVSSHPEFVPQELKVEWPSLVRDGGWREQKKAGNYWPRYFRVRRGGHQTVTRVEEWEGDGRSCWVLEVGYKFVSRGSLSKVLFLADSVR